MKKALSVWAILLANLYSFNSFAQEDFTPFKFIESGELMIEASEHYLDDNEDYDKAIEMLQQVDENDTNYYDVQYDIAYLYYLDSNDQMVVETCNRGLQRPNNKTASFVNLKGLSLDRMGNAEESISLYTEYIQVYPQDYLLYYNLAIAYEGNGESQKSYDYLKKTIELNPFYTDAYRLLGARLSELGEITAASLCYHMALLLSPNDERAPAIIFFLESLMQNSVDPNDSSVIVDDGIPSYFSEIDLILKNRLANNKQYKLNSEFDFKVIRTSQVAFEKLENPGNDTTFWNRYIVRNFYDIWNKGLFEGYSYYMFQSLTDTDLKRQIEKRSGEIEKFKEWAYTSIIYNLAIDKRQEEDGFTPTRCIYYDDNHLQGRGPVSEDFSRNLSPWSFFHENGKLMSRGGFDEDNERHGFWEWWYDNGLPKESATYQNGKLVGPYKSYNELGNVVQSYSYNEDNNIDGPVVLFSAFGVPTDSMTFKDGKRDGSYKIFHNNGELNYAIEYKNGKFDGEYASFYNDRKPYDVGAYDDGEMSGPYKSYHRNGQLKSEGEMVKGQKSGPWKFYYDNGQISTESEYKNGGQIGLVKSYYRNGAIESEKFLDESGKENGEVKRYDDDGKLYEVYEYTKGVISAISNYDKDGNLVKSFERKKSILTFEGYSPRNVKLLDGAFSKEERVNHWTYYDDIGVLDSEMDYVDGELEGAYKFYGANGELSQLQFYKEGLLDSLYVSFYVNGKVDNMGYYVDDELQGPYLVKSHLGDTLEREFYSGGKIHGRNHYYTKEFDGTSRIKRTYTYYYGKIISIDEYDSTGKVMYTSKLNNGSGKVVLHFPNGFAYTEQNYVNGQLHGPTIFKHGNGKINLESSYEYNQRAGDWTWFDENGKKVTKGSYEYGSRSGRWVSYFPSGNEKWVRTYTNGDLEGRDSNYYENGNLRIITTYKNGMAHGPTYYFGFGGDLYHVRHYYNGLVTGYSYPGTNGELKETVELQNGTGPVVTYYENGQKAFETSFKNGELHGSYKTWHSNGKPWKVIQIEFGENQGIRKEYDENGVLMSQKNYIDNYLEGVTKLYHKNGKLKSEGPYWDDDKHGVFKIYNEAGSLINTQVWVEGSLMKETAK